VPMGRDAGARSYSVWAISPGAREALGYINVSCMYPSKCQCIDLVGELIVYLQAINILIKSTLTETFVFFWKSPRASFVQ